MHEPAVHTKFIHKSYTILVCELQIFLLFFHEPALYTSFKIREFTYCCLRCALFALSVVIKNMVDAARRICGTIVTRSCRQPHRRHIIIGNCWWHNWERRYNSMPSFWSCIYIYIFATHSLLDIFTLWNIITAAAEWWWKWSGKMRQTYNNARWHRTNDAD